MIQRRGELTPRIQDKSKEEKDYTLLALLDNLIESAQKLQIAQSTSDIVYWETELYADKLAIVNHFNERK